MELTKQGQRPQPPLPLPSPAHRSAQVPYPAVPYPDDWGAQAPTSSYLIVPMGQQPAKVDVPRSSEHHPVARPLGRVSLRPPQQVLSVQTDFPELFMPQPSPSPPSAGKKIAVSVSPKVQMLMSLPSQLSAGKRSVQKESPPKAHSQVQLFESVRSKFRETLAAALSMDSDQQIGQESAGNLSPVVSQPNPKRARVSDVHAGVNVSQIRTESERAITTDEAAEDKKVRIHRDKSLAFTIEEELFKSFGGVNKKYKEKGRSLLFNLKDKNNPVLRERVLSGDITPKCLCAMTIEELASKELSEWRVAKAEVLANMVVLPDREVDVRRLVRKTHKGDFQVEVDETDVIEVGLGGGSLSYVLTEPIAVQTKSVDKTSAHKEVKESDNSVQDGFSKTCNSNTSSSLEYPAVEKSDLMQGPMIDDLQVTKNVPQVMTLDELMQILHTELHSEDHSAGALQDDPSIGKADKALKSESSPIVKDKAAPLEFQFHSASRSPQENFESKLESPINKPVSILDPVVEPKGDVIVKSPTEKVDAENPDTVNGSIPESTMQCKITPDAELTHDSIWEGAIQLSLTSLAHIVAIFKSGEKPSTNEWRRCLEVKGRVRLSVFKEFIEHLPNSRSRAIMVTELCSKEGTLESGRHHLLQTIDSYIADGRVGLVKLAEGMELYLCPQGKATQILADHLPKEHLGSLTVTETSIIGLVVWRRPHVSPRVPNRQDVPKSRDTVSSLVLPRISQPPSRSSNACRSDQDVVTADVLPSFGPGGVKDDDDLPEYNFDSDSDSADNATTSQTSYRSPQHTSLSTERFREMVRKYGNTSVAAQPWNGDGDEFASMARKYGNIPEWNPNSRSYLHQAQIQQPQSPYYQQPQYHSMLQCHMTREPQGPLHQAYTHHQQSAMPVQHPLTYEHLMHPAQQSYYGVPDPAQQFYYGAPDGSGQSYFGACDGSRMNGAWDQGLMGWNPW